MALSKLVLVLINVAENGNFPSNSGGSVPYKFSTLCECEKCIYNPM
jgi:hypothetical protein